jgi:prevent-host-death family protein
VRTIGAKEAKQNLGGVLDAARQEPVAITRHGRPVAVVVAVEDYQRLARAALAHAPEEAETARLLDQINRDPIALARLRAEVAKGERGEGVPADAVLDRLEARYRKMAADRDAGS